MAKNPADIPKHVRIDAVKRVFMRWRRLDKTKVDELVSAALDTSPDSLSRALYRDLGELVELGFLDCIYFTRDGIEIKDYDPEKHRNTVCQWITSTRDGALPPFSGYGLLGSEKIFFVASERLMQGLSFHEVKRWEPGENSDHISLTFSLGVSVFNFRLSKESLPFSIAIGRTPAEKIEECDVLSSLEKKWGKRVVGIYLPIPSVSTFKLETDEDQRGHAIIHFDMDPVGHHLRARIEDLGSKNGTYALATPAPVLDEILQLDLMKNQSTVPVSAHPFLEKLVAHSISAAGAPSHFSTPFMLGLSKLFRIVIS